MSLRDRRNFPNYTKSFPASGPDWVWRRAETLVSVGRYAPIRREGPNVARAARFIRARLKQNRCSRSRRIIREDPDLLAAMEFADREMLPQLELQARILGGESTELVAASLGLETSVVQTYCTMFFDVVKRLDAKQFILYNVIKLRPPIAPSAEQLFLLSAYHRGAVVIDAWIDWFANRDEIHDLSTAIGRQRESIALFVLSQQLPGDSRTQRQLLKIMPLLLKTEHKSSKSRSVREQIAENVSRMLAELPGGTAVHSDRHDAESNKSGDGQQDRTITEAVLPNRGFSEAHQCDFAITQ